MDINNPKYIPTESEIILNHIKEIGNAESNFIDAIKSTPFIDDKQKSKLIRDYVLNSEMYKAVYMIYYNEFVSKDDCYGLLRKATSDNN